MIYRKIAKRVKLPNLLAIIVVVNPGMIALAQIGTYQIQ
jgi:hypothetical protein